MSAPIDWKAIKKSLRDWVSQSTHMPVVWANQRRAPQAPLPFARLQIVPGLKSVHGDTEYRTKNPDTGLIDRTIAGVREFTVTCQVFTESDQPDSDAMHFATIAHIDLAGSGALALLADAGLSVVKVGDMQDLSAIAGGDWESRAVFEVRLRTIARRESSSVPPINVVNFGLSMQSGVDGEPITNTVHVDHSQEQ